jgi:hypothetical protein
MYDAIVVGGRCAGPQPRFRWPEKVSESSSLIKRRMSAARVPAL